MINRNFATMYARIAPARIYFLRFILEGYDGMTTLSTVSAKGGIVILRFPDPARGDLIELLDSLAEKLTPTSI